MIWIIPDTKSLQVNDLQAFLCPFFFLFGKVRLLGKKQLKEKE